MKWEYKVLFDPTIEELNKFGFEGWELVSNDGAVRHYLKRNADRRCPAIMRWVPGLLEQRGRADRRCTLPIDHDGKHSLHPLGKYSSRSSSLALNQNERDQGNVVLARDDRRSFHAKAHAWFQR